MHRLAVVVLLVACTKEKEAPPAPPPVAPQVNDAPTVAPANDAPTVAPIIDAADAVVVGDAQAGDAQAIDAPVGKPGGVKGKAMYKETTPANTPPTPIASCSVLVTDVVSKQERTTTTNAKGEYRVELPPGTYAVNLGACQKGVLDCGNPGKKPLTSVVITDGEWQTFSITSNSCNKCLDASAPIATPDGPVAVDHLRAGDRIYVLRDGKHVVTTVAATQRIPATALARRIVLADGRVVVGSGPHPLGDGRLFGAITANDRIDGVRVERVELVPYRDGHAYDLLPAIDAPYLVDGVPVRSTMSP